MLGHKRNEATSIRDAASIHFLSTDNYWPAGGAGTGAGAAIGASADSFILLVMLGVLHASVNLPTITFKSSASRASAWAA
jgi:hypothetical protein